MKKQVFRLEVRQYGSEEYPYNPYKEVKIGKTIYRVTSFFSGEKELGKTLEQLAVRRAMSEVSTPASCSAHTAT